MVGNRGIRGIEREYGYGRSLISHAREQRCTVAREAGNCQHSAIVDRVAKCAGEGVTFIFGRIYAIGRRISSFEPRCRNEALSERLRHGGKALRSQRQNQGNMRSGGAGRGCAGERGRERSSDRR